MHGPGGRKAKKKYSGCYVADKAEGKGMLVIREGGRRQAPMAQWLASVSLRTLSSWAVVPACPLLAPLSC